jgi:hypothetical protein
MPTVARRRGSYFRPMEYLIRPDIFANLASGFVLSLGIVVLVAWWDAQNQRSHEGQGSQRDDSERDR